MRGKQAKQLRAIARGLSQNEPTIYVQDYGVIRVHPHSWRAMYKRLKANFHRLARKEHVAMRTVKMIREHDDAEQRAADKQERMEHIIRHYGGGALLSHRGL